LLLAGEKAISLILICFCGNIQSKIYVCVYVCFLSVYQPWFSRSVCVQNTSTPAWFRWVFPLCYTDPWSTWFWLVKSSAVKSVNGLFFYLVRLVQVFNLDELVLPIKYFF